jgi:hypothetical protein
LSHFFNSCEGKKRRLLTLQDAVHAGANAFHEATNAFLDGDVSTGKTLLRDYLNATEALPSIARELA